MERVGLSVPVAFKGKISMLWFCMFVTYIQFLSTATPLGTKEGPDSLITRVGVTSSVALMGKTSRLNSQPEFATYIQLESTVIPSGPHNPVEGPTIERVG